MNKTEVTVKFYWATPGLCKTDWNQC